MNDSDFPEPGTPGWEDMNARRYELVCRNVSGMCLLEEVLEPERL